MSIKAPDNSAMPQVSQWDFKRIYRLGYDSPPG